MGTDPDPEAGPLHWIDFLIGTVGWIALALMCVALAWLWNEWRGRRQRR